MKPLLVIVQQHQKVTLYLLISLGFVALSIWPISDPGFGDESRRGKLGLLLVIPFFGFCALFYLLSLIGFGPRTVINERGIDIITHLGLRRQSFAWPAIGELHASTHDAGPFSFNKFRFICAFTANEAKAAVTHRPDMTPTYKNAHVLIPLKLTIYGLTDEAAETLAQTLNEYRTKFLSKSAHPTHSELDAPISANDLQRIDKRTTMRGLNTFLSTVGILLLCFFCALLFNVFR